MTAREASPRGETLAVFFLSWVRPSPRPRKVGLAGKCLSEERGSRPPPRKTGEGVLIRPGAARPCRELGNPPCRAGGMLQRSLRIPRLERGICGTVPLRGKGSRPPPEENGEGVSFARGQPAPAGDWGKPPCRAGGYAPEKFENSPTLERGSAEVSLRGKPAPLSRSKQGRECPVP